MFFILLRPGIGYRLNLAAFLLIFAAGFSFAADNIRSNPRIYERSIFPEAFYVSFLQELRVRDAARPFWVASEAEYSTSTALQSSLLLNNYILSFYGHPLSRGMGVIGRYPKPVLLNQLNTLAAEYREIGGKNIIKAFHIIYGTVHPDASIGTISHSLLREWIEFALENDMLIFIDHQMGRYTPEESLRRMLPWLRYPNVHLAIDPEWRTLRPLIEIGHVTADELNQLQGIMEDYLIENNLPGERFLVVHQFNRVMIRNRENVRTNFSRVRLIHNAAGIGTPQMKRDLYEFTTRATNMPINGFKLWFDFGFVGHTDNPLMTPREVFGLHPRPYLVMYQ